jgi:hypothetical protein
LSWILWEFTDLIEESALPCANPNSVRFPVLVSGTIILKLCRKFRFPILMTDAAQLLDERVTPRPFHQGFLAVTQSLLGARFDFSDHVCQHRLSNLVTREFGELT